MKKIVFGILFATIITLWGVGLAFAQTEVTPPVTPTFTSCDPSQDNCYQLLEPLPQADGMLLEGLSLGTEGTGEQVGLGGFINLLFEIGIGVAGVLGVVMLVIYGFQYASGDKANIANLDALKTKVTNVVIGLLLLLGTFIILRTINPDLTLVEPDIESVTLAIAGFDGGYEVSSKANSDNDKAWVQANGKILTLKKKTGGTVSVKACDDSQMQTITLFDRSFTVHKSVIPSLKRIEQKWKTAGGQEFYKIPASSESNSAMGAYVCRTARGSSIISWHSYGLAIDINPKENPYSKKFKTNMPQKFVDMWYAEGWGWGGDWSSVKDTMHFSKLPNEGGDATVD